MMTKSEMDALWKNLGEACKGTTLANGRFYFLTEEPEFKTNEGVEFANNLRNAVVYCSKARINLRSIREKMDQQT